MRSMRLDSPFVRNGARTPLQRSAASANHGATVVTSSARLSADSLLSCSPATRNVNASREAGSVPAARQSAPTSQNRSPAAHRDRPARLPQLIEPCQVERDERGGSHGADHRSESSCPSRVRLATPSGSGNRGPRIHTSCAVVVAPTFDRALARWCFTVECDSPRRCAAAFSDPAAMTATTTASSRSVAVPPETSTSRRPGSQASRLAAASHSSRPSIRSLVGC